MSSWLPTIRSASGSELDKVPYTLVVGEKEQADRTVSIRDNRSGAQETHPLDDVMTMLAAKVKDRS